MPVPPLPKQCQSRRLHLRDYSQANAALPPDPSPSLLLQLPLSLPVIRLSVFVLVSLFPALFLLLYLSLYLSPNEAGVQSGNLCECVDVSEEDRIQWSGWEDGRMRGGEDMTCVCAGGAFYP